MKITKTVQGIALGTSLAAFVTLGVPSTAKAENLLDHNQMEQVGKKKEEKKDEKKKDEKKKDEKKDNAEGSCGSEDGCGSEGGCGAAKDKEKDKK